MTRVGRALLLVLTLALVALGSACGRGASSAAVEDYQVAFAVEPSPAAVGPATVTVTIHDRDGKPVTGARVQVEGNMTHAGMKPVFADAAEVGDGRYVTDGFAFTMGGDWILTARVTLPDGTAFEQAMDLPGVQGEEGH
ncbi:MAG: FixH family protein [Sphaerobacter sp.]|nr:FixH family protein [Sphaerobacter sp.]